MTAPDTSRHPTALDVGQIGRLAIDTDMFALKETGFFDETPAGSVDGVRLLMG
jgi:hypothetical protein